VHDVDAAAFINHPSGFLACSSGNRRFCLPDGTGFIAYREQGRHRIAFGGVHSPVGDSARLLRAFLEEARASSRRALFVQVPAHQVEMFEAEGATVNRLGSTFAVRLAGYSLKGTSKIALRNKIHRAERAGLRTAEIGREVPASALLCAQIRSISEAWLRAKGKQELAFMVGVTSDADDRYRRTFVAIDRRGNAIAFVTYVPAWGERPGYLHDLSRRRPDAPPGVMELINAFSIRRMQEEGVRYLHFGFTPFVMTGNEPASASGILSRLAGWLYRHGSFVYPAQSQASYKRKWGADLVAPEYLAGFPLTLPGALALLRLTRAL
jgi:lysylphosphatidylglycerol synthetase-like protein (DUF2156 family)